MSDEHLEGLRDRIVGTLESHHRAQPLRPGLDAADLRRSIVSRGVDPDLAEAVVRPPYHNISQALGHRQIACKSWLRDELVKAFGGRFESVWVVGGWYGVLPAMLFDDARYDIDWMVSFDVDADCAAVAKAVNRGPAAQGRFEALTGEAARRYLDEQERRLKAAASALKVAPAEVVGRLEAVLDERRKLERELAEARKKLALGGGGPSSAAQEAESVNGVGFVGRVVSGVSPKDLKPLADEGKKQVGSGVVVFVGTSEDGKASVVENYISYLRKKIDMVDPPLIHTVRGFGYVLRTDP
jgi:hypothetical protein